VGGLETVGMLKVEIPEEKEEEEEEEGGKN
jgi:hypothetical protein